MIKDPVFLLCMGSVILWGITAMIVAYRMGVRHGEMYARAEDKSQIEADAYKRAHKDLSDALRAEAELRCGPRLR